MVFSKPIDEVVRARISVRTYMEKALSAKDRDELASFISSLTNPFSAKVRFKFIEAEEATEGVKLGTYGMIKGAATYIGSAVEKSEFDLEALGYEFEELILFAADMGMGTCWLGGTFTRNDFAKLMGISHTELFPAVTPIGYAAQMRIAEHAVRASIKADQRKDWDKMFFSESFAVPLFAEDAGEYAFPIEMTRLAPSASNKQPWRIVKAGDDLHFFEYRTPGYSDRFEYDIQRIDMGIAACHFHLAAVEIGLQGSIKVLPAPDIKTPPEVFYAFSWIKS